jgi:hypothetical protein
MAVEGILLEAERYRERIALRAGEEPTAGFEGPHLDEPLSAAAALIVDVLAPRRPAGELTASP